MQCDKQIEYQILIIYLINFSPIVTFTDPGVLNNYNATYGSNFQLSPNRSKTCFQYMALLPQNPACSLMKHE